MQCFVHFLLLNLFFVLILIRDINSDGLEDISDAINMLLTYFLVLVKSINIIKDFREISKLFDSIRALMNFQNWMRTLEESKLKLHRTCIELQIKIKNIVAKIGEIFTGVLAAQGLMSIIILCTTSFSLTAPMMFQILLPCYYFNEIITASEKLSTRLFHSNWMQQCPAFKTMMKIFMEYSKKPMKVAVMKVFEVNLENFVSICNAACTLFVVFKKINSK